KPLRFNQFGVEVDGPVYIPKLYDGRNKTFFTASYEGLRQKKSTTQTGTTITQAMRDGDFSAVTTPIVNPFTGVPYAGNQIPTTDFSDASVALLQYYPLPTVAGTANYISAVPVNVSTNQSLERVDQNVGDRVRLFFRYDWQNTTILGGTVTPT